jgi:hypothetical protein
MHSNKKKNRYKSQKPLCIFMIATGICSVLLKVVTGIFPGVALSFPLFILLVIWLIAFIATTIVCLIVGYRRNEFNAMEIKQLRILVKIVCIGVPFFVLYFLVIHLLGKFGVLT